MALLVDTSVWSLAYRRDTPESGPEVAMLRRGLTGGERIGTAGFVLLELPRGAVPKPALRSWSQTEVWVWIALRCSATTSSGQASTNVLTARMPRASMSSSPTTGIQAGRSSGPTLSPRAPTTAASGRAG